MTPQREADNSLVLTLDEVAVIKLIRQTPYGEVTTKMYAGAIRGIERNQSFKPPSLDKQPRLLAERKP